MYKIKGATHSMKALLVCGGPFSHSGAPRDQYCAEINIIYHLEYFFLMMIVKSAQ